MLDRTLPNTTQSSDIWQDKPIHHQRPLKVVCIGAGASGLMLAYKFQRSFENFQFTIYEKNADIGGTWLENNYPGCACDITAHVYTWSFEPNPNWSSVYAGTDEILKYFNNFCDKHDLRKYCQFKKRVTRAEWDNAGGYWEVEITDEETGNITRDYGHFLLNATGFLNHWKWPDIPELHSFEGKVLHTARWDRNLDLTDKHVAVLGTGSSALQLIPAILPKVKKITSFNRTPTWVFPTQALQQRFYSEEEIEEFNANPEKLIQYRKELDDALTSLFPMFSKDSPAQKAVSHGIAEAMKEIVKGSGLEDKIVPSWGIGCRRITPGVGYLEALVHEKTEVVLSGVKAVTPKGCVSEEGKEYPVDIIVCATGFDTSYIPYFPVVGLNGRLLSEAWEVEPQTYFGIATPDFPNYFVFLGPTSPVGNGPVQVGMEAQADYALKLINRWQTENIHSITPKAEAVQEFMDYKNEFMKNMVWSFECRSWYKSHKVDSPVRSLWPGSSLHHLECLAEPRYEDWNFTYIGNRFAYLGNGRSQTEMDSTADWSWYRTNEDNGPLLGRAKHRKAITKSGTIARPEAVGSFQL
ncbi:Putative sterigmatocystin biosynthesis monooxygenase stcW [Leucoagaricus sp. SymC.cos]|nr:Putative sterigmatocystin biosynthesis monooxygenase stcW [Leucoagaricus sp. SymC.cos]